MGLVTESGFFEKVPQLPDLSPFDREVSFQTSE